MIGKVQIIEFFARKRKIIILAMLVYAAMM